MAKKWTPEEVEALRTYYPEHGAAWAGWDGLLGRTTRDQIYSKVRTLGLSYERPSRRDMPAHVDRVVTALERELVSYAKRTPPFMDSSTGRVVLRDLLECAPSLDALIAKAGVDTAALRVSHGAKWTEKDDRAISEAFWRGDDVSDIAEQVGRTQTATRERLKHLGLHMSERGGAK